MKGFLLDLNRCTGCQACRLACSIENDLGMDQSWREVLTFNMNRHPGISRFHLSLGCHHCASPACMSACPALAYSRDAATGAVLIDDSLCIGCKYCSWACPFDAPRHSRRTGTISKCTLCRDRLLEGKVPACASLCPTGALQYVEVQSGHMSESVPGFPATDLEPAMRFVELRSGVSGPEMSAYPASSSAPSDIQSSDSEPEPKITLDSDWSIVFFTLAASVLVAIGCAAMGGSLSIDPLDFLIASLATLGVSALHLGKWQRASRAILNLRHSWLSREILFYLVFTVLTVATLSFPAGSQILVWPAALSGFACLFCIDQVYEAVGKNVWSRLHSARALLTGLFLLGVLAGNPLIAGLTGLLKLVLYAYRQPWFTGRSRLLASVLRLGLGFVLPLAVWRVHPGWVLPSVLVGEVIDRCEYYLDLDIVTPRRQIVSDLKKKLAARLHNPAEHA